MLSKFLCHLFLRFEHGRFCVVSVTLISVDDFVGRCFWLLFVLIPILFVFFSGAIGKEYVLEM